MQNLCEEIENVQWINSKIQLEGRERINFCVHYLKLRIEIPTFLMNIKMCALYLHFH